MAFKDRSSKVFPLQKIQSHVQTASDHQCLFLSWPEKAFLRRCIWAASCPSAIWGSCPSWMAWEPARLRGLAARRLSLSCKLTPEYTAHAGCTCVLAYSLSSDCHVFFLRAFWGPSQITSRASVHLTCFTAWCSRNFSFSSKVLESGDSEQTFY